MIRPRGTRGSCNAAVKSRTGTGQSRSHTGTRRSTTSVYAVPKQREPVAEADGVRTVRLQPVEADAVRAARDAECARPLAVTRAVAPAVDDERRLREQLASMHRDLPGRRRRLIRFHAQALQHLEHAVGVEREDRARRGLGELRRGGCGQREGEQADDYPATRVTQIVSSPPEYGRLSNQP